MPGLAGRRLRGASLALLPVGIQRREREREIEREMGRERNGERSRRGGQLLPPVAAGGGGLPAPPAVCWPA